MKVLLVEDSEEYIEIFKDELQAPDYALTIARSRRSALVALERSYELVVCDLRIPTEDGGLDDVEDHGMAIVAEVVNSYPGTPLIAFSAYGTIDLLQELMRSGRHGDYLGVGQQDQLVDFFSKNQVLDCLARIRAMHAALADLRDIELSRGGGNLVVTPEQERAILLFARRVGGTLVHVRPLNGGLSSSRVLHLTVENTAGHLATVVAKVDHLSKVQHERRNVESFVAGALPVGAFPAIASVVEVGAGAIGGLFYQAAGFEDSLLDIIQRDPDLAAKAVDAIALHLAKWRDGGEKRRVEVGELRRHLAPDGKLLARQSAEVVAPAESVRIHAQSCVQHGDLHVFNILVADDGRPIVIDFNDTGPSFSALDAVCLELSVLMHEGAAGRTGDWPTPEEAALWPDLDSYVQRCPYRPFVVACRRWARDAAAADGEILAAAYAYAIRQLRFDGCPQPVASAIAAATSARLLQR